jgi:hypothetical protein
MFKMNIVSLIPSIFVTDIELASSPEVEIDKRWR